MDAQDRLSFITALGEEFCHVLDSVCGNDIAPHDGYEVFVRSLGKDFDPEVLQSLSESQFARTREVAEKFLETADVTVAHIREIVRRTLVRWPVGD